MESGLTDIKESVEISRLPCIRNEQFFEGGKNRKRRSKENGSHVGVLLCNLKLFVWLKKPVSPSVH